jgi:hypothetical protein
MLKAWKIGGLSHRGKADAAIGDSYDCGPRRCSRFRLRCFFRAAS